MSTTQKRRRFGTAAVALGALLAITGVTTGSAMARPGMGGPMMRPHGFHGGGYHGGGYYGGHHHGGLGVGAAVGLGVLGAAAAGVAASQYYNGYPVYPDGAHTGYGYDYYPDHGGYYGPY